MKINFYFIRHGPSIHGENTGINFVYKHITEYDPTLSINGVRNCIKLSKIVKKYPKMDYVLSSPLMRAIMSSFFIFLNSNLKKKFSIEPYISEMSISKLTLKTNTPRSIEEQNELIKKMKKNLVKKITRNELAYDKGILDSPDLIKFINYFLYESNYKIKNELNVAVVTHSNLMVKSLKLKKKPKENGIIKASVEIENLNDKKKIKLKDLDIKEVFEGF